MKFSSSILAGLAVVCVPVLRADEGPPAPEEIHQEKPNMPYFRTEGPRILSGPQPADFLRLGPFQSVQVNTAANGMNLIGDAAYEPSN
ncbi:MAG: hypothetical protein AB7N71_07460, partial [Phycisphaerae bacterium]